MRILDNEKTKIEILEKLKKNIAQCLYLAIDLEVCGLNNSNVTFYYDDEMEELPTVIMMYYDTIQMYAPLKNDDLSKYVEFIKELKPIAICARKDIVERLEPYFEDYKAEYGIVISDNNYMEFKQFDMVRIARLEDVDSIVELMMATEEFSQNNTCDSLKKQLEERIRTGQGRSFVIEEDGKIVAHTAIYAEIGDAAVESGLVVHELYKKKFYGMIIHEYIKKILSQENRKLFGLRYNESLQNSAQAEKLSIESECGRLIKSREE